MFVRMCVYMFVLVHHYIRVYTRLHGYVVVTLEY